MRAIVVVLVGVTGCGPGLGPVAGADVHEAGRNALVEAAGTASGLMKLFRGSVVDGGLWFDDAACARQFGGGAVLEKAQLEPFARCLAGLHLQASTRADALGDVVVMTYAPGIEIEARIVPENNGMHLTWIGYESRRAIDAMIPTVTSEMLESVRLTGDRNGPLDPSVASTLELDPTPQSHAAFTWIRLCLDEMGTVTLAHPFQTTSVKASAAFEAVAKTWTFRPFTIKGAPVPICSMVRMAYPPGQAPTPETLPLPPPPSKQHEEEPIVFVESSKEQRRIEGKRIAGMKMISPDDDTKTAIQHSGVIRVIGSFRVCIDALGMVESILPLRSTGFAAYDRRIIGGIQTWRYSPYAIDDRPVPVCTTITFIYSQR